MRKLLLICAALFAISLGGCAAVAEAIVDGIVCSLFDNDDEGIDPSILERKGIEPGSKRAKRLEFETEYQRSVGKPTF